MAIIRVSFLSRGYHSRKRVPMLGLVVESMCHADGESVHSNDDCLLRWKWSRRVLAKASPK